MKPPYRGRGTKKCCFCCDLDPDYTCYLIGTLCLVLFAFGGFAPMDYKHPLDIGLGVFIFCYYLTAGLCLILGTLNMNKHAKIAYCWMMLLGILILLCCMLYVAAEIVQKRAHYFNQKSDTRSGQLAIGITFSIMYFVLIFFSLYTPCVVIGNLDTYRQPPA